jgi:AcrR family transcriptional regulator
MGSAERRTRERVETRQRILAAAREMFVEEGYDATTMRAIADRIEYTPTAIYHHFQNKEALLAELCALDFQALAAAFQKLGRIADPIERLRRCGRAYVEFGLQHPMQYQLMFMTSKPPEVVKAIHGPDPSENAYEFLRMTCAEVIATGRVRPEYRNVDELAVMSWSAVHGLLSLYIAKEKDVWIKWKDPRGIADRISNAMLVGVLRESPD